MTTDPNQIYKYIFTRLNQFYVLFKIYFIERLILLQQICRFMGPGHSMYTEIFNNNNKKATKKKALIYFF